MWRPPRKRKRAVKFGRFLFGPPHTQPKIRQTTIHQKGSDQMTLQNTPSIMDLIRNADSIPELDLEAIGLLIEDAKSFSAKATRVSRALQEEAEHRLKDQIQSAYLAKGEDTGTVKVESGVCVVEVTRAKKVEWDQAQLKAVTARIAEAGDDPAEYIETSLSVSEKRYVAWPTAIQKQFEPARTVVPGNVSIKIKSF